MASLNSKAPGKHTGLLLSCDTLALAGYSYTHCAAKVQVLLKHLKVYSEQLAVSPAATTQGGKLRLGSPKLEAGKENLSLAVPRPSREHGQYGTVKLGDLL